MTKILIEKNNVTDVVTIVMNLYWNERILIAW